MEALLAFLATVASSALLTWATLRVAGRAGWLDRPGRLKPHTRPVPTLGGIAVVGAFLLGVWTFWALSGALPAHDFRYFVGLSLAGVAVAALGVWDDLVGCSAWQKFSVQILAALTLHAFGYGIPQVTNPFDGTVWLDYLGFPLTVLWIVGITNAVNLIDGVDGLAAGVVLISSLALTLIAFEHGERLVMIGALILAGSLIGFIGFNLPSAKIFLGDTGSLFLGLAISAVSLLENQRKGTVTVTLLLPIVLMAIPIIDTVLAISRRMWRGRHPFQGDTDHLHHRLLRLGLSPWQVLAIFYGGSAGLGGAAYLLSILPKQHAMVLMLALAGGLYVALLALRAVERERRVLRSPPTGARRRPTPGQAPDAGPPRP